ncbi:Prenylcysteine lyase-domain-containing protein [Phycomyces blakesleeanus]|uniref:Prenylcysteine lyase-domain-containing protein n=1 Tax=Phycomyces blakesleeanus TaxID=4837 RepID=A0ABR3AV74_PHYBL
MRALLFLLLASPILCQKYTGNQLVFQQSPEQQKRVAIIGGGAAGTSAAFWLKNAFENTDIDLHTTLYESSHRLGGRTMTTPVKGDPALGVIEVGASIFVEANHNLMNATKQFGLNRTTLAAQKQKLGVWDGQNFLFQETGSTYWDGVKFLWRYGSSPLKANRHLDTVLERFELLYENDALPYYSIEEAFEGVGIYELLNTSAQEYLESRMGVNTIFSEEIVQSATRANYGQDIDTLHALGAMVSLAAKNSWSIQGGNFKIFEEFAERSGAEIRMETTVKKVEKIHDKQGGYTVTTNNGDTQIYDAVILAAPFNPNEILELPVSTGSYVRDYKIVHVTLLAGYPDPSYFSSTENDVPNLIITTGNGLPNAFSKSTAPFTTFAVHRILENGESIVKIFSSTELKEELLDQLFYNRTWTYHQAWNAFPVLHPNTDSKSSWPPIIIDGFENPGLGGLIYVNAFESAISTMETQTIASKNAAKILHTEWCTSTLCRPFGDGW